MKNLIVALILCVTSLSVLACKEESASKERPATSATADGKSDRAQGSAEHAPAQVTPGSYEDWCGEHQVPESMCTRCNPSLIAAFKATHDWCKEHGLPESQCLLCNPELKIERPPQKKGE